MSWRERFGMQATSLPRGAVGETFFDQDPHYQRLALGTCASVGGTITLRNMKNFAAIAALSTTARPLVSCSGAIACPPRLQLFVEGPPGPREPALHSSFRDRVQSRDLLIGELLDIAELEHHLDVER